MKLDTGLCKQILEFYEVQPDRPYGDDPDFVSAAEYEVSELEAQLHMVMLREDSLFLTECDNNQGQIMWLTRKGHDALRHLRESE
jgi:hypothetical protein